MEQIQGLLGLPLPLPLPLLSVLVAGYLSYRVAYIGRDATHKTIDTLFLVSVFALIAQVVVHLFWSALPELLVNQLLAEISAGTLGIVAALAAASFWRKWGEDWISGALKWARISFADRNNSAWETVMMKSKVNGTVLVVRKKDGSEVMSEDLSQFNELPFGSCVLGRDGSVALYVTHRRAADADDWSERDVSAYEDWGAPVTIVPASEVAEIEYRAA